MTRWQTLLLLILLCGIYVTLAGILEAALYVGGIRLRDYHLFPSAGVCMLILALFYDLIAKPEGS